VTNKEHTDTKQYSENVHLNAQPIKLSSYFI